MLRWALGEVDACRAQKTRSKKKKDDTKLFAPWANAVRDLKLACDALGIPRCSPNDFRRTYATWMGLYGVRDELIQRCLGQAPTSVLDRHYRKYTDDDLLRLVEEEYRAGVSRRAADKGTAPSPNPPTRGPSVHGDGIEPPTRGFSIPCSTD
jgi:hypothetical protein